MPCISLHLSLSRNSAGRLKELDLSNNRVRYVGASLSRFEQLVDLRLAGNGIREVKWRRRLRCSPTAALHLTASRSNLPLDLPLALLALVPSSFVTSQPLPHLPFHPPSSRIASQLELHYLPRLRTLDLHFNLLQVRERGFKL